MVNGRDSQSCANRGRLGQSTLWPDAIVLLLLSIDYVIMPNALSKLPPWCSLSSLSRIPTIFERSCLHLSTMTPS